MSHFTILDLPCRGASRMIVAVLLALAALAGTSRGETYCRFPRPWPFAGAEFVLERF